MKKAISLIVVLLLALISQGVFIVDHFQKVHYVEQKSVPDTIIVPETIEKLLYDTIVIHDTFVHHPNIVYDTALIETLNVNNLTPSDFDSALEALEGVGNYDYRTGDGKRMQPFKNGVFPKRKGLFK